MCIRDSDKCTFDNGVENKAATCTEPGVKTFTCSDCGGTYTVAIPATEDVYKRQAVRSYRSMFRSNFRPTLASKPFRSTLKALNT